VSQGEQGRQVSAALPRYLRHALAPRSQQGRSAKSRQTRGPSPTSLLRSDLAAAPPSSCPLLRNTRRRQSSKGRRRSSNRRCHCMIWPQGAACWGKWPSEALSTSGQADGFGSRAASAIRESFCSGGLTGTLMLLELCEFCCAGAAHLSGAGLRCRKHGQLCFGAEGLEEPGAPRVENASVRGWRRPGRDVPKGTTRPGRDLGLFRCRRCGALRHMAAANV
jgi:hypothetical protein